MKTSPSPPYNSFGTSVSVSTILKITALTSLSFLWSSSCRVSSSSRALTTRSSSRLLLASPLLQLQFQFPVASAFAFVPSNSSAATMSTFTSDNSGSGAFTKKTTSSSLPSTSNANSEMDTSSSLTTTDNPHPLAKLLHSFDHSWINHLSTETEQNRKKSQSKVPNDDGVSNNVKRPVFNGHWVRTIPDPLRNPRLIIHSPDVMRDLGLMETNNEGGKNEYEHGLNLAHSEQFVKYFSGDVRSAFQDYVSSGSDNNDSHMSKIETWATPYALSIMGTRYTSNCPYNTGDGYGDGRAMSIGEVKVNGNVNVVQDDQEQQSTTSSHSRYELQLKGAGPTPFCRGADGRAVLRSSIREFLASEAMHYLGISTTRALSLIVSEDDVNTNTRGNTSQRPWYSSSNEKRIPDINDVRLARYSMEQRKQIIAQLNAQTKNDPDVMIEEPNAITCRVSPSFMRVGHIDLFARRATMKLSSDKHEKPDRTTAEFQELEDILWHACFREFPETCYHPHRPTNDIVSASKCLLDESLNGIATMVGQWVRVGFTQGNFNGDNCLVAGRTMDYGPFGYVEEYHPLYAKWTGSGEHFGFMNQPNAGYANFVMLVSGIMPILQAYDDDESMTNAKAYEQEILEKGQRVFEQKLMENLRPKLGFHEQDESADDVWQDVELLMRENRVDWTLFWRQLTYVMEAFPLNAKNPSQAYGEMYNVLIDADNDEQDKSPFYEPLDTEARNQFLKWIQSWRENLEVSYDADNYGASITLSKDDADANTDADIISPAERMRLANPKYVLREWMLVDAYTKASTSNTEANNGPLFPMQKKMKSSNDVDESMIHELFELIQNPYDEGSEEQDAKYYKRASKEALKKGGVAFMS